MLPVPFKYVNGNGTVCMIGDLDETGTRFLCTDDQPVDYGMDFYAPQTIQTPDGRTVMIAWMQNWDTVGHPDEPDIPWHNQMTVPREIHICSGKLLQWPVRELDTLRKNPLVRKNLPVSGDLDLPELRGRTTDIVLSVRGASEHLSCPGFTLYVAQDADFRTELHYSAAEGTLTLDRTWSGSRRNFSHIRTCRISEKNGTIRLRVLLDRFSLEVFANGGEEAMTAVIRTGLSADRISFHAEGDVLLDLEKYDL